MSVLAENKIQYQKEQDQILKTILDYRFFKPWNNIEQMVNDAALRNDSNLELFISGTCNQHCDYCYLYKHKGLYPPECDNPEQILKNLKILYDYILVNDYNIPIIDIFSGEIWHTQFGLDILQITLDYIKKGMKVEQILTTTNGYFLSNDISFQKIQSYINQFNNIGCPLVFSLSIDGKILDNEFRARNNGIEYDDNFYDHVFSFCRENNFLFHPMVSSKNVFKWKENYEWWKKQLNYYNFDFSAIMTLEVRNADWTTESIKAYCEFNNYLIDDFIKNYCHNSIETFAKAITGVRKTNEVPDVGGYHPWTIGPVDSFLGCTVSNHLTVRVGDLAICPCHRTAYKEYLYGYFVVENDQIVDIKSENPLMAMKILMGNLKSTTPLCTYCIYNDICLHGCLGSQLETMHDPFFPIDNVCKLFRAKYHNLLKYYRQLGVIDYLKQIPISEIDNEQAKFIVNIDKLDREVYPDDVE